MSDNVRVIGGVQPPGEPETPPAAAAPRPAKQKAPLYPQLLRLKHVHPNAWQRAVLGEGMALIGLLLALADVASAWSVLVLPVAVALVVKAHDVLAGVLADGQTGEPEGPATRRT